MEESRNEKAVAKEPGGGFPRRELKDTRDLRAAALHRSHNLFSLPFGGVRFPPIYMTKTFHIFPVGRQPQSAGGIRLVARYERRGGETVADAGELWYEFQEWPSGLDSADADPFLMVTLPMAMEEGRDLQIHGAVSRSLLANLIEFRDYWCNLAPLRYQRIEFSATTIREDGQLVRLPGAVALFSGGVDAAFTYWRHTRKLAGTATQEIKQGIFVDGFDRASFLRRDSFLRAYERTRKILAAEPVPLISVRTNYRQVEAEPFASNHLHMIASSAAFLGSCLHLFKGVAGTGLYASTFSYHEQDNLWRCGTNPVSDRFLSSAGSQIIHDGAAISRIEKTAVLAGWPAFLENARVCGKPRDDGMNCGQCEKCLRTILAALVVSGKIPAAFPVVPTDIAGLVAKTKVNPSVRPHWQEMVAWARAHDIDNQWVALIETKTKKPWKERRHEFKAILRKMAGAMFN